MSGRPGNAGGAGHGSGRGVGGLADTDCSKQSGGSSDHTCSLGLVHRVDYTSTKWTPRAEPGHQTNNDPPDIDPLTSVTAV